MLLKMRKKSRMSLQTCMIDMFGAFVGAWHAAVADMCELRSLE
jgi:hypothetical protein